MLKWLREHLRTILIVYIVEAAAMTVAGIVMSVISFTYGLYPIFGSGLFLAGLVQLFAGIWLFKTQGKGIWGSGGRK